MKIKKIIGLFLVISFQELGLESVFENLITNIERKIRVPTIYLSYASFCAAI